MTLIEAVCDCGHRQDCSKGSIAGHMHVHATMMARGGRPFYWHIEHDGEDLDALSGAERRRRAAR